MRNRYVVTLFFFFMLGLNMVLPVFTKQDSYTIFNVFQKEEKPTPVADGFNSTENLGWELLKNDTVIHAWNTHDSYYFNATNGVQITNHYEEYWTHNVLMLGYYSGNTWNLLYRTDELSGFNREFNGSTDEYMNLTLWKDLSYASYSFRLALRYHLGVNDSDLTIVPYIKNLGINIPFDIGFGWEIKDWDIPPYETDDCLIINNTNYPIKGIYNLTFKNLNETFFKGRDTTYGFGGNFLRVDWNENLNYIVKMYGDGTQENFSVALFIKVGTLSPGQEKSTIFHWIDALVLGTNCGFVTVAPTVDPDGYSTATLSDYALALKDVAPETAIRVKEIGFWNQAESGASTVQVGIYTNDAPNSEPQALVGYVEVAKDTTVGWQSVIVDIAITEGVIYWIAVQCDFTDPTAFGDLGAADVGVARKGTGETELEADWGASNWKSGLYSYPFYAVWDWEAEAPSNTAPTITGNSENPLNQSTDVGLSLAGNYSHFNITIADIDADDMNITWNTNETGSWKAMGTNTSVNNGTYYCNNVSWVDSYSTKYWWNVSINDGMGGWINATYFFTTEDAPARNWQQITSGYFKFGNTASFKQQLSGYFGFGNTASYKQSVSGWFNFNNAAFFKQSISGYFNFANTASYKQQASGYFTFSNSSAFKQQESGWFNFNNIATTKDIVSGYFLFNNAALFKQTTAGYFTFGNTSSYNQLESGYFSFGNTSSYNQLESGYFSFGNSASYKQQASGWFTFSNIASFNQQTGGWFNFHNISIDVFKNIESGYFSFGNIASFKQEESGWFKFSNVATQKQIISGWFVFKNTPVNRTIESGYFNFANTAVFKQQTSGWFVFGNTSIFKQLSSGWFTFGNTSSYKQLTSGWFSFRNISHLIFSGPNPSNSSTGVSVATATWNITIQNPLGSPFNWSIQTIPNVGSNNANGDGNGSKIVNLAGLGYSVTYRVYVNATDGVNWTRAWYQFTTENAPGVPWVNRAPVLSNPIPANGSIGIPRFCKTNITVSDLDGNSTTVCFWNNKTGPWVKAQQNNTVPANTTVRDMNASYVTGYITGYWLMITAYDSHVNVSVVYHFTTMVDPDSPINFNPSPTNGSTGNPLTPVLMITIVEPHGHTVNITFETNVTGVWGVIGTNANVSNGTYGHTNLSMSAEGTAYYWRIITSDGAGHWTNDTYHFTTLIRGYWDFGGRGWYNPPGNMTNESVIVKHWYDLWFESQLAMILTGVGVVALSTWIIFVLFKRRKKKK